MGLFSDSIRVQLFSNPQQTHASNTNTEPMEKDKLLISSKDNIKLATVTNPMAIQRRFEIAS